MDEKKPEELTARVDEIFKQKDQKVLGYWQKRGMVKVLEMIGFIGMFLCTSPIPFTCFVLLTALTIGIDFYLQYSEWKEAENFNRIFT